MRKDKLESFIQENRAGFDFHSPEKKIWTKIKPANSTSFKSSKKFLWRIYRVAAVLIIFVASYAFHEYMDIREERIANDVNSDFYNLKPEIKEAEFYYNNQVSLRMNELRPLLTKFPELESEVQMDLSELDSIYITLKEDLKENIDNEQVLEAMIQNYRLKIKILEDLLYDISPDKTRNETSIHNI